MANGWVLVVVEPDEGKLIGSVCYFGLLTCCMLVAFGREEIKAGTTYA